MVKKFIYCGVCFFVLYMGIDSCFGQGARSVDVYKNVIVKAKIPATLVKGREYIVGVILENPAETKRLIEYIRGPSTKEQPEGRLPVGLQITNLETKTVVYHTPSPSPSIFFEGVGILEWPEKRKGQSLQPGEEIREAIDITGIVAQLAPGNYRIIPIVWVPIGYGSELLSEEPITVSVTEEDEK